MDEEFWNPINFNEPTNGDTKLNNGVADKLVETTKIKSEQLKSDFLTEFNSNGNTDNLDNADNADTMDSKQEENQIDCEVMIEENLSPNDLNNETSIYQMSSRKLNNKSFNERYHQILKKDLNVFVINKDPVISFKDVTSRKPELINNYKRVCFNGKETEFVKCVHCRELLCYSSYDGTTSVNRHLSSCVKQKGKNQIIIQTVSTNKSKLSSKLNQAQAKSKPVFFISQMQPQKTNISQNSCQFNYSKLNDGSVNKLNATPTCLLKPDAAMKPIIKIDNSSLKKEFNKQTIKTILASSLTLDFLNAKEMRCYLQRLITIGASYGNVDIETFAPRIEDTKAALNELANKIQKNLKSELDKLDSITLLIDDFRCKLKNDKFSVLAVQYSKNGCLNSRVLGLKQAAAKLTTQTNQKEFKDYLNVYDLNNTEIVSSSSIYPKQHFNENDSQQLIWLDCSVNQLNQVLDAMCNSLDYDTAFRDIAYIYHQSPTILHYFNNKNNIRLNSDDDNLSMFGHQLFYTVLNLIERNQQLITSDSNLNQIFNRTDFQVDLKLLGKIKEILRNFYDAKKYISTENSVTINLILPCFKKLILICATDKESDYRIKNFKCLLSNLLDKYFIVTDKHMIATFLTPRFKKLHNLCTTEQVNNLILKIKQDVNDDRKQHSAKKEEDNFFEFCKSNTEDIGDEVDRYLNNSVTNHELNDCPLKFWQKKKESFVKLSEYATDILSVPASSTGLAEKSIFKNDLVDLTKMKAYLNDYLFVKSNLDLIENA